MIRIMKGKLSAQVKIKSSTQWLEYNTGGNLPANREKKKIENRRKTVIN